MSSALDLLELLLFEKKIEEFDKTVKHYESSLMRTKKFHVIYFCALRAYITTDSRGVRQTVQDYLGKINRGEQRRMMIWDFEDFQKFADAQPASPFKEVMSVFTNHLAGQCKADVLENILSQLK